MMMRNESNNSLSLTGNVSMPQKTVYEMCSHMPELIHLYMAMQFINMFMGIPANLLVLWLIHSNRSDSSTSDIFIWHLAMLDTLFCLIPLVELTNLLNLTTSSAWYAIHFFYGVKDLSPFFLACICMDRYMAVCHPITFSNLKDQRHRSVCAGVVWFIILVYASLKCMGNIHNFDKVFTVIILAMFAFMLFCNISILWALSQSGPGKDDRHPVKKRAFKMVLIILAIIVFNYFPPVALLPFQTYFSPDVFICYISFIAFSFMDISSSIQPVLYLSNKKPQCPAWCCESCRNKDSETGKTAEASTMYTTNG